jgi:hypothetical protein
MPSRAKSTTAMRIRPMTVGQRGVSAETAARSTVSTTAPTAGPRKTEDPPAMTMSMNRIDMDRCAVDGLTTG